MLRPGGIFALSTELHVDGVRDDMPGAPSCSTRDELPQLLLDGFEWELVEPLDLTVSPATRTRSHELPLTDAARQRSRPPSPAHPAHSTRGLLWTSVHVVLRKPGATDRRSSPILSPR